MPDEVAAQASVPATKKDEKRNINNRGPQKNSSGLTNAPPGPRPNSGSGQRKTASPAMQNNTQDGGKRSDQRSRNGPGGARGSHNAPNTHRKTQSNAPSSARGHSHSPKPPPIQEQPSEALSSLQRVIADLKTTPASNQPNAPQTAAYTPSYLNPNPYAPVFQPSVPTFRDHRKAVSMGAQGYTGGFNSFSPHLGSMTEDVEESQGNLSIEEGEIRDQFRSLPSGDRLRSSNQNFVAPRFAALAAQQEHETTGPTGRPQLAPGFHFGAQRSPITMAPPISDEDVGFQFPQQHQLPPKAPAPEVTGIMAEQRAIQDQIELLQAQQAALYQQQLASNQVMSFQTPGLAPNRNQAHRRVQSTIPMGMQSSFSAGSMMGQFPNMGNPIPGTGSFGTGLDGQSGVPRGHGRRHSVNVVNKTINTGSITYPAPFADPESFDDGFAPPATFGGHSRQGSRVDNSWRINGGLGGQTAGGGTFGADLAQAQAQLQSLQQFRAAAGGHHQKMASFSFPNMLPNMMAANMLGLGGVNVLQQQHQQFQSQLQQQSNQPQRKSLFAPYLPQASLPPLLAAGKLVVGILRVNKRNRSDAYVATEVLDADIYICGSKDRNRALEGDIVAVELLEVEEVWNTKREKEDKKRKKEENAAFESRHAAGRKDDKRKDDVEVEGQGLMLFEDEEVTDDVKPQFAGHVVAVVERMPGQLFSGTLGLLRPSSAATKEKQEAERREREGDRGDEPRRAPIERPKIVWFKPTDKRVPLIAIPTEQAPPDFVNNADAYVNNLFVACIKRHPISSLHPFGTLVEDLGPIGNVEVETSALLKDCNFPTEDFPDNVMKCLPPLPWTIPEHEIETRRDLRQERIFTIDPPTARDLDDAISIKHNEDGTYDVGIHITDVSYFVKPNTALDRDARKRATSVYLVQRAVPMLPPGLSEELCSLNPGQDRLAITTIFTLNHDAEITKTWFGKTVIRSVAKLSYANAQDVIEGQVLSPTLVSPEHSSKDITHDIQNLERIAKKLRAKRIHDGALTLDSHKLSFVLDAAEFPIDCSQSERVDASTMVEEFMLMTNIAVARHVACHLPEQALLRRHDTPIERRMVSFAERAKRIGYEMDISSAGALMRSFGDVKDPTALRLLQLLSFKATHRARYFCAGMLDIAKYSHYALNVPLYTHFTSPIRRYADVLVHRQLDCILSGGADKFLMDRDAVAKVAQQCNIKRDSAKLAQEQSTHLYLCILISDLTQRYGPVIRQAKVVGVLEAAFDVLVPEFGIEKRVHVDQMPIDNHVYDQHTHSLQIYWSDRDVISWLAENSDDEHLKKVKQNAEHHAQSLKMEVVSRNVNDERALFDEDDEDEDEVVLGRSEQEKAPETSVQRLRSIAKAQPQFEGLRTTPNGHQIQEIKELMSVPVIVTADLTRSPPVIKVYSVNPHAKK